MITSKEFDQFRHPKSREEPSDVPHETKGRRNQKTSPVRSEETPQRLEEFAIREGEVLNGEGFHGDRIEEKFGIWKVMLFRGSHASMLLRPCSIQ